MEKSPVRSDAYFLEWKPIFTEVKDTCPNCDTTDTLKGFDFNFSSVQPDAVVVFKEEKSRVKK